MNLRKAFERYHRPLRTITNVQALIGNTPLPIRDSEAGIEMMKLLEKLARKAQQNYDAFVARMEAMGITVADMVAENNRKKTIKKFLAEKAAAEQAAKDALQNG